jgi:hypothetical protein
MARRAHAAPGGPRARQSRTPPSALSSQVMRGHLLASMSAAWLGGQGSIPREVILLFVVALPVPLAGTSLGLKFYGRLMKRSFARLC